MTRASIEPPPRLVLFDLDDTLCDYATARAVRLRLALSAAHHPGLLAAGDPRVERMVAEALASDRHGVDHFPALLRRHGIGDPEAAAAVMRWFRANRFHGLRLFPDALATIGSLRSFRVPGWRRRRRIGVVTNGPAGVQDDKVRLLGIDKLVDFVLISDVFGSAKPDAAIFREALRLGGVGADDSVFVGDSPEFDIAGAQGAGIRAVWMNRSRVPWSGSAVPPIAEVERLTDLIGLLGGSSAGMGSPVAAVGRAGSS